MSEPRMENSERYKIKSIRTSQGFYSSEEESKEDVISDGQWEYVFIPTLTIIFDTEGSEFDSVPYSQPPQYFFTSYRDAELFVQSRGFKKKVEVDSSGDSVLRYYPPFMNRRDTLNYYKVLSELIERYGASSKEVSDFMHNKFPGDTIMYFTITRVFNGSSPSS